MNSWMKWKNSKIFFIIVLGLIFIAHFPFINADPDRNMSVGRGPFTDEGLNTSQVRNWVNQGELNLSECDNLLKTPMFGFPLAVTYKIFGVTHEVSRLHVLVLVFLALLMIGLDEEESFSDDHLFIHHTSAIPGLSFLTLQHGRNAFGGGDSVIHPFFLPIV